MKFKQVIKISRPRFWVYELGTFVFGALAATGSFSQLHDWRLYALGVYFLLPANILIYGINDIYDYETDKLNPKKVQYEALVTPKEQKKLWRWILVTNIPFLAALPYLPGVSAIALLLFAFFATFYSAKPIRAKARPVFDSFFSAAHYVVTGLVGYALIAPMQGVPIKGLVAGLLWAMAMHAYSAVPDIEADTKAQLDTVATKFKAKPTILLCAAGYALSALLASQLIGSLVWVLLIPYLVVMVYSYKRISNGLDIFKLYTYFPWVNMIVGAVLSILLLLRIAF